MGEKERKELYPEFLELGQMFQTMNGSELVATELIIITKSTTRGNKMRKTGHKRRTNEQFWVKKKEKKCT